jgi:hypothetical protein
LRAAAPSGFYAENLAMQIASCANAKHHCGRPTHQDLLEQDPLEQVRTTASMRLADEDL